MDISFSAQLQYRNPGAWWKATTAAASMATMAEQMAPRITETEVAYKRSKSPRATERARGSAAQ